MLFISAYERQNNENDLKHPNIIGLMIIIAFKELSWIYLNKTNQIIFSQT